VSVLRRYRILGAAALISLPAKYSASRGRAARPRPRRPRGSGQAGSPGRHRAQQPAAPAVAAGLDHGDPRLRDGPVDDHRHRVAGVIDEQLVAAGVGLLIVTEIREAQPRYSSQNRE
jgi:hypothetical protein